MQSKSQIHITGKRQAQDKVVQKSLQVYKIHNENRVKEKVKLVILTADKIELEPKPLKEMT
jgi:hypothetical protein